MGVTKQVSELKLTISDEKRAKSRKQYKIDA